MDPVYVTQTTIAVTIFHKIHYSIEVPKTKQKRIIGFQNIIGLFIILCEYCGSRMSGVCSVLRLVWGPIGHHNLGKGVLPEVTSPEMTSPEITWSEVTSVTWPEMTSEVVVQKANNTMTKTYQRNNQKP